MKKNQHNKAFSQTWDGQGETQRSKQTRQHHANKLIGGVGVGGWGIESHATLKGVDEELRKGAKN